MYRAFLQQLTAPLVAAAIALSAAAGMSAAAQSYQVIDHPSAGANGATVFGGVSDGRVVGYWGTADDRSSGSFVYSGGSFTPVAFPGGTDTLPWGISGSNIVGQYTTSVGTSRAFVYDGATYTGFDYPVAPGTPVATQAFAADAGAVVGSYETGDGQVVHGFVRSPACTFTTLDLPESSDTALQGISGSRIVGDFLEESNDTLRRRGFVYENGGFTLLDYPGNNETFLGDVQGKYIVGSHSPSGQAYAQHGFIFDGSSWSTFSIPGASRTLIYGIDGNTIVGSFTDDGDTRLHRRPPGAVGGGRRGGHVSVLLMSSPTTASQTEAG